MERVANRDRLTLVRPLFSDYHISPSVAWVGSDGADHPAEFLISDVGSAHLID
jgi:hypothetical protein